MGWNQPLGGDFERQGAIKPKGEIGAKQHKGDKNAQPLTTNR